MVAVLAAGCLFSWVFWQELRGENESLSTTLRNLGLIIGGVIAIILAVWRSRVAERQASAAQAQAGIAHQQVETAQQGLLNERYQRGAEMLGSPVLSVRLGGIYALGHLAEEYPELYHVQVMQIFCAFVRNPVEDKSVLVLINIDDEPPHKAPPLREDVQAIMDAISTRTREHLDIEGKAGFQLNLTGSDLRGANLINANLTSAHWEYSPEFSKAEYLILERHTDLSGAKLCSAKLAFAELQEAVLTGACLCEAWLARADLSEATLAEASLHGALSSGPILSGTEFSTYGRASAKGIRQSELDSCLAAPGKPPDLSGACDFETGAPLVWRRRTVWRVNVAAYAYAPNGCDGLNPHASGSNTSSGTTTSHSSQRRLS